MKDVIGYVRTSMKKDNSGLIEQQEDAIRKYCAANGLNLLEVFKDEGVSGLTFDRAGWFDLKDYLYRHNGRLKFIVVPDFHSISRDVPTALAELQTLRKKYGVKVRSLTEGLNEAEKLAFKSSKVLSTKRMRKNGRRH